MLRDYWVKSTSALYRVWRDPVKRAALIMAILASACLILIGSSPKFTTSSKPQLFPSSPGLEVQFIRDVEDLRLTLGEAPSLDRQTMQEKLQIDFVLITAYTGLFLTLSVLLARSGGWKKIAAILAGACGVAAGMFDVLENLATLRILDLPIRFTTEAMLDAIRSPAKLKWTLAAIAILLLATYFVPKPKNS